MHEAKEKRRMTPKEIQELMDLKGWSRTKLAAELDVTEPTIHSWMAPRRVPGGPAVILMRMWIEEAKAERRLSAAPANGRKRDLVGAK